MIKSVCDLWFSSLFFGLFEMEVFLKIHILRRNDTDCEQRKKIFVCGVSDDF